MRSALWMTLALVLAPAAAGAQQATDRQTSSAVSETDSIVVTGRPVPESKKIRALTRAITPSVPDGQPLQRFDAPICVGSSGLAPATLLAIGDRIAQDAEQAGLKLAGERCKPNIVILFVDNVEEEIARLGRQQWAIFGDRTPSEIREIARERGPVRAWHNSEIRGADGDLVQPDGSVKVSAASRLVSPTRRDTVASIVLVERKAVIGKTANQLGDYLAMRALAVVNPQRASGSESILTLFDPRTTRVPDEMTAFDRGYLRGLYTGPANLFASTQQNQIVRTVLKDRQAVVLDDKQK